MACTGGQVCVAGVCGCANGGNVCNAVCHDTNDDPANCGVACAVCRAGQNVQEGKSVDLCARRDCDDDVCTDINTDSNHCGAGCTACTGGQVCAAGVCGCPNGENV